MIVSFPNCSHNIPHFHIYTIPNLYVFPENQDRNVTSPKAVNKWNIPHPQEHHTDARDSLHCEVKAYASQHQFQSLYAWAAAPVPPCFVLVCWECECMRTLPHNLKKVQ